MDDTYAPRTDTDDVLHGVTVADPYRWLEDPADARTRAWLARQRERYRRHRDRWGHAAQWADRLTAAIAEERSGVPVAQGERMFYIRRTRHAEYPTLYVSEAGSERALLDPLALDPSGDTVLEAWHASVGGDLVAYQISQRGDEDCQLYVLDVATGETVAGPIDRVRRTPVAWLPDGKAFYYVRRLPPDGADDKLYHRRIFLHRLGTDPADDALVFGEGRPASQFYTVAVTPDGRWLTISTTVGRAPHNELWLADLTADDPARPTLVPVYAGGEGRVNSRIAPGTTATDPIWLRTTVDAPRGRVVVTTPADPGPHTWRTLIPERADAVLQDFLPLTGPELPRPVALVSWTRHAVSEITVHDLRDGRELGAVKLPGVGSVGMLRTYPRPSHEAWFTYTDHTTPPAVLRFDARTERVSPVHAARGTGHPGCRAVMETTVSRDGTPVRVFIISPHGEPDRPRPTLLTGYGGFGVSMTPAYNPDAIAWVTAGGVFAIACLRGGSEEGAAWHRAGTGRNKQRVFDDFDAVTDHLVQRGWTDHQRLGILGNSNGGLLIAAALTQHPEKYGAAASLAPLTDMVRYERSGMGPSWRGEYGTVDDPEDFAALFAYSPYHRVRPGAPYPPVLMGAFEADSRVDPAHARKFTAALQHAAGNPVVLRVEDNVGHGNRSRSRLVGLQADVLAFFGHHLGLCPQEDGCACSSAR